MALSRGFSMLVPRYCCKAFSATRRANKLPFGNLHGGEGADLLRVMVRPPRRGIELQRQQQPVPHELQIPIDGFGADFELAGEG
jgi:hypothetical protein